MGGGGGGAVGRGVVEPFSMEKPFSAVWEVKLVGFFVLFFCLPGLGDNCFQ